MFQNSFSNFGNWKIIPLLEKYPTLIFYENLVDLNEVRMHEATLNLDTHAWVFFRLSIASVDGKQHLSVVVFSALVGFSMQGKWRNVTFLALDSDVFGDISLYQESKEHGKPQESGVIKFCCLHNITQSRKQRSFSYFLHFFNSNVLLLILMSPCATDNDDQLYHLSTFKSL